MEISCERGSYHLSSDDVEDFPMLPAIEGGEEVNMSAPKLRRMIGKTIFAVSRDELQPALTGVLLELSPEECRCVSTDGYRLVKIIDKSSSGFIYYISVTGVTGPRKSLPSDIFSHIKVARKKVNSPVCIGFGISSQESMPNP